MGGGNDSRPVGPFSPGGDIAINRSPFSPNVQVVKPGGDIGRNQGPFSPGGDIAINRSPFSPNVQGTKSTGNGSVGGGNVSGGGNTPQSNLTNNVNNNNHFVPSVYQPVYQDYNMTSPMGVSQYGTSNDDGSIFGGSFFPPSQQNFMPQMQTPFGYGGQAANNYSGSDGGNYGGNQLQQFQPQQFQQFQQPLYQRYQPQQQYQQPQYQQPQRRSSGPSSPIVGRSSSLRGTPNVMRRAEGGIMSLMDEE